MDYTQIFILTVFASFIIIGLTVHTKAYIQLHSTSTSKPIFDIKNEL